MSRFAFVVPPFVGHTNPTIAVGEQLAGRKHEVAWIGDPAVVGPLLPPHARLLPVPAPATPPATAEKLRTARGLESIRLLFERVLFPQARATLDAVQAAVESLRPDVLVVDQQAFAGSLVARRMGLPWASSATTSALLIDPFVGLPKVQAWLDAQFAELQADAGLPVIPGCEISPHLFVIFSTQALIGSVPRLQPHYKFVGPSLAPPYEAEFPFEDLLPDRKKVLISLGTIILDRHDGFFDAVVEAFEDDPTVQIILVAPEEELSRLPSPDSHMIVRRRVPQVALLSHLDAVVCHGGHNTVCEALAHGLPLVAMPVLNDQPVVAQQVAASGAGIRLRYGRVAPARLRETVHEVLSNPSYRTAARRIQESFQSAGGARRAATLLEDFALSSREDPRPPA